MSDRSYAIIGTGAIGGFYGARLQRAGLEVHFLLHGDYQHVRQHGLVVESVDGNFTLPQVRAYDRPTSMPKCDVVAIALKSTQNHLLPQLLPPLLGPNSIVLLLQNGLGVEADVAQLIGDRALLGGLCFICSNKVGAGHIRHLDYGAVRLGSYAANQQPAGVTADMEAIAADLQAAGIAIELEPDLMLARWKKLVWNVPFNGLSVVLDAQTDELMANPETRQLAEQLMNEVVAAAAGCDRHIPPDFVDYMLGLTETMKPYLTSMKLDYNAGRELEVEAILGNPVRMAKQAGVDVPRMEMLYRQVRFLMENLGSFNRSLIAVD
jgi:2-dehydropantoate 2-reductase